MNIHSTWAWQLSTDQDSRPYPLGCRCTLMSFKKVLRNIACIKLPIVNASYIISQDVGWLKRIKVAYLPSHASMGVKMVQMLVTDQREITASFWSPLSQILDQQANFWYLSQNGWEFNPTRNKKFRNSSCFWENESYFKTLTVTRIKIFFGLAFTMLVEKVVVIHKCLWT